MDFGLLEQFGWWCLGFLRNSHWPKNASRVL
ncbi:unnamed protein product [Spirodela intermedia]|uniref:Uncharacterized protein n=1 Tax=Spirodela intermedia TaxID=51605 RepID=A0A7I8KK88_SPIIN|nr:unnamed protein product [Spirodela intermedia]